MVKKKPIVVYKAGRFEVGVRAALSHTASIAGNDKIFEALCRQAGLIRCYDPLHTFDMAVTLASQPLPKNNRVAIISGGGGYCVTMAEACVPGGWMSLNWTPQLQTRYQKFSSLSPRGLESGGHSGRYPSR